MHRKCGEVAKVKDSPCGGKFLSSFTGIFRAGCAFIDFLFHLAESENENASELEKKLFSLTGRFLPLNIGKENNK